MTLGVGGVAGGFAEKEDEASAVEGAPLNELVARIEHLRRPKGARIEGA